MFDDYRAFDVKAKFLCKEIDNSKSLIACCGALGRNLPMAKRISRPRSARVADKIREISGSSSQ
jgi:hypothetical protein